MAGVFSSGIDNGLFYHLIDMDLDNGLGDVVMGEKNVVVFEDSTSEKIAATKHANGIDYWVMIQQCGSNKFHAFLVTESGVSTNPVTSEIGPVSSNYGQCNGSLRFNPSSDLLIDFRGELILMQFDNATGVLSNEIIIPELSNLSWGTEFSPDGTKMYAGGP